MLKLKRRGDIRIELPGGVAITAPPITADDIDLAEQAVRRRLGEAADAAEALARYGLSMGVDAVKIARVPDTLLAIELGIQKIKSWEGVGTDAEEDEAAPVEPGFVLTLFKEWIPGAADIRRLNYGCAWLYAMLAKSTLERSAPKGSAASPGTSTAAAASNAGSAANLTPPARPGDAA
jgi:hypothetical protein